MRTMMTLHWVHTSVLATICFGIGWGLGFQSTPVEHSQAGLQTQAEKIGKPAATLANTTPLPSPTPAPHSLTQNATAPVEPNNAKALSLCKADLAHLIAQQKEELVKQKQRQFNTIFNAENSLANFNHALEIHFMEQPIDTAWAKKSETEYTDFFKSNNHLAAVNIMSVECRTDLCKISVEGSDTDTGNKVSESLALLLKNTQAEKDFMVKTDVTQGITDFYISKDHKSFEFN